MSAVLPDVLAPNLKIVFCGTAAGNESARQGAYYAHPGNKFWRTLFAIGLTPRLLLPREFPEVLTYGVGLTDLAKFVSGNDDQLKRDDFDAAVLRANIELYQPRVLAFTSKNSGRIFHGGRPLAFGRQAEMIGGTTVFVLPSPSGLAQRAWNIDWWQAAADFALENS